MLKRYLLISKWKFKLNNKIRSGRHSGNDNDLIHDLINNNPPIITEKIVEKLYVDNLIAFRHLKKFGNT